MRLLKKIIFAVILTPVLVVLVPILIVIAAPFILVFEVKARISLCLFRRRESSNFYLICTSHRSWHDFLRNNVIPILPDNVRVVWRKPKRDGKCPALFNHLFRSHIFNVAKPYLVAVTSRALIHKSLNGVLQDLKAQPKISKDVRRACARIITETQEELRAKGSTVRA